MGLGAARRRGSAGSSGEGYPWSVIETPSRHLPLDGTRNVRDIGGYQARDGRRTRWRTLLRSDELTRIPDHAQEQLVDLGLRQVIDLRWPEELAPAPKAGPGAPRGP